MLFLVDIETVDQQRLRLARHAPARTADDEIQDGPILQIQIKMPQKVDFRHVVRFRKTRPVRQRLSMPPSAAMSRPVGLNRSSRRNHTPREDQLQQETLRMRNRIERVIGHLKTNRALATRYDQLAESFVGMLYLAAARYWIKFVHAV